jgi:putative OPT family oligopeptide transporter
VQPPPRGELTPTALIAAALVAGIMGASYPYMVLKLGFGPNVSVVAAFFGFLILNLIARRSYDRWQNNVVQTAGTSAAQTAFMCVLLGAFDMLRASETIDFDLELTPVKSFLWLWIACTLGVLLAVPLRRHFIVDEKLPYADGVAAGETLIVLDPPRGSAKGDEAWQRARKAAKALGIGVLLSALVMLFRDDSKMLGFLREGWDPGEGFVLGATGAAFVVAHMGVGVSYSLLAIGSGMLIGLRINISMIIGGVLAWIVFPYFLIKEGVLPDHASRTQVLYWIMWPATGMLVAGGLAALALRWRLLVDTFRSLRGAKISSSEFPLSWVGTGVVVLSVALCIVQYVMLDMPIWMTLAAIVLSVPLMLVGLRVLGETNWGPISALSNMMQGVFAVLAPGHVGANMVASGTTGTIAVSSEAIMQDYKAGEMIGSTPRVLTIAQLLAVPIGAAAVAWTYPALVDTYGIVGEGAQLTSPISRKWAGFAELLKGGTDNLANSAMWALLVFAILGIVFTVLESNKKLKPFVPSPTGIGIGMLVPFTVIASMLFGGIIARIWERADKKSSALYLVPLASGFIAGEALIAVFVPLLIFLGLAWGFPLFGG